MKLRYAMFHVRLEQTREVLLLQVRIIIQFVHFIEVDSLMRASIKNTAFMFKASTNTHQQ